MSSDKTTGTSSLTTSRSAVRRPVLVPHVPDGGYGWVICFSAFMLQALTIGITYSFGVVFVALLKYFNSEESTTAWIGSIQPALLYFTGIIAGPLINRIGWRAMTISGAILSAVGYGTSALAPNIYLLYFTYGVLTGIGNGFMYVTSMVAVQHYFKKKRAMATGIAVSGSGIGTLIFGILSHVLIERIGWRLTLLVNCAITLVVGVIGGVLFRPLPLVPAGSSEKESLVHSQESSTSVTNSRENSGNYGSTSNQNKLECSGSFEQTKMDINNELHPSKPGVETEYNTNYPEVNYDSDSSDEIEVPLTHDTTGRGKPCGCNCGTKWDCATILREVFDLSLFTNPVFSLFCFSVLTFALGYHVPYTYTPERAILLGIPPGQASALISIMGVSNVGFRLILGWIADKSVNIRFYFAGVVLTFMGCLNLMVTLFNSYPLLVLYSVLFGAFSGSFASLFPVILVDLLGLHLLEKSMGQALAVSSIAFLIASPLSGYLIVSTGNISLPFMVMGGATALGGQVYFLIRCFLSRYGYQGQLLPRPSRRRRNSSLISESFS